MKKQFRKLLSALLVLTMLLSALPMAAFAEEGKATAIVTEVIDTHTHEQTEESPIEPTIELIEAPAVEEADEPATEPIEEPAVEDEEEPVAEPAEALEDATAVEPETESEQEPAPAVEENTDEAETEEASEPAENEEEDPLSGLTDEQLAVLKDLPEGFSADVVAFAMLSSTGCQHIDPDVIDEKEIGYTKLDKEKHIETIAYTSRSLYCGDCGQTLQTINYEKTIRTETGHSWYWCGWDESESSKRRSNYSFRCACGEEITIDPPCNHESLVDTASEGLICGVCHLKFWPGYDNDAPKCKHTNYTVVYDGEEKTFYLEWDYETHLRKETVASYYFPYDKGEIIFNAKCNDCGIDLYYNDGEIDDNQYTSVGHVEYKTISSEFEAHSFVNGVCEFCGEEKVEETCQHTNTKRVENTSKRSEERKPFDDAQHEVIVTKYYERHCADCNAYISDDGTEETTSKEAHDFSNGDTCECGYKKSEEDHEHNWVNVQAPTQPTKEHPHHYQVKRCTICNEEIVMRVMNSGCCLCIGHEYLISVYNYGVNICRRCGDKWYTNKRKEEFYSILKTVKAGENPLEKPQIVKLMLDEMISAGYSASTAQDILWRANTEVPDDYRDIFVYSFFEYKKVNGSKNQYNGVFVGNINTMFTNADRYNSKEEFLQTYFHETGHAVDYQPLRDENGDVEGTTWAFTTSTSELHDLLVEDTREFIAGKAEVYAKEYGLSDESVERIIDAFMSGEVSESKVNWYGKLNVYPPQNLTKNEQKAFQKTAELCYTNLRNTPRTSSCIPWDVMTGMTRVCSH